VQVNFATPFDSAALYDSECAAFRPTLACAGTIALAVAIIHANFITAGAKSHYLMGIQLICSYLLISSAFLFTGKQR
jgi:hypothetical protein